MGACKYAQDQFRGEGQGRPNGRAARGGQVSGPLLAGTRDERIRQQGGVARHPRLITKSMRSETRSMLRLSLAVNGWVNEREHKEGKHDGIAE